MCYGGGQNGAEGADGGGSKSADCRPANWRPLEQWGRQLGGRRPGHTSVPKALKHPKYDEGVGDTLIPTAKPLKMMPEM